MPKRLCNQFLPKTLRFSLQRHKSCKKLCFLRLFAGFFMEESCRGFFASNWLCSKPGRSLCERIKLTFATAPGCLHSLSLGRHDRFGRLCNQFLPKTLRFSLQRHKSCKKCSFLRLFAGFRLGVFSRLCDPAGCVRIWLGAFGK